MTDVLRNTAFNRPRPVFRTPAEDDLLLRETHHRCNNDLQLVISLLTLQSNRTRNAEARAALTDMADRVAILARARSALQHERQPTLENALRQVCEALQSQTEPRSILVSLEMTDATYGLSAQQITTLALIVNELATNAIKHAFEVDQGGRIRIVVRRYDSQTLTIIVDDDGIPFPSLTSAEAAGWDWDSCDG